MSNKNKSAQMTLNVFGFVFLILGIGLESRAGPLLIGLAIALFVSALVMAAVGAQNNDTDSR